MTLTLQELLDSVFVGRVLASSACGDVAAPRVIRSVELGVCRGDEPEIVLGLEDGSVYPMVLSTEVTVEPRRRVLVRTKQGE